MDGEWQEVNTKKKKKPQQQQQQGPSGSSYGGVTAKGTLVPGAIQQNSAYSSKYGGGGDAWQPSSSKYEVVNHASAVADYDFGVDEEQKSNKFETYSTVCSNAVANARMEAKLTQAQLATKVNDRTAAIVELENGTGRYDAGLVNRIESALRVQIPRGRQGAKKSKK